MGNVITIGELMLRFTPKNKQLLKRSSEFNAYYGGAEANVAMSLSYFGHCTSFLSSFPANDIGDAAIMHLESAGVDTSWLLRDGDRLGTYFYEDGFSLRQPKVIYDREFSSIHHLPQSYVDWKAIYKDVDMLHITGITPALSAELEEFTLTAIKEAKKNGVKVSFDFNYREKLWSVDEARRTFLNILPYVDICFAGYKDFVILLGERSSESFVESELSGFYEAYAQKYDIETFASTNRTIHSATSHQLQGYLYQKGQFVRSCSYSFEVLGRIGGGDAFAAGVLHGILTGMNPVDTIAFSTASSVLKHMVYGDHNPYTKNEVDSFLQSNNSDVNR